MGTSKAAMHRYVAFAREYVKSRKPAQAAVKAGYSQKSAANAGSRLLKNVHVQAEIVKLEAEIVNKTIIDVERVLRETARIALADPRLMFNEDGSIKDPKDWPDEVAANIASVEVDEIISGKGKNRVVIGYAKKVKLWNKVDALDKFFRHFGMYLKDNDQVGKAIGRAIVVPAKSGTR